MCSRYDNLLQDYWCNISHRVFYSLIVDQNQHKNDSNIYHAVYIHFTV